MKKTGSKKSCDTVPLNEAIKNVSDRIKMVSTFEEIAEVLFYISLKGPKLEISGSRVFLHKSDP